jgi:hypothetical protein
MPKGCHHNPLGFQRRWMALKKWLRLLRDHTPGPELELHSAKCKAHRVRRTEKGNEHKIRIIPSKDGLVSIFRVPCAVYRVHA